MPQWPNQSLATLGGIGPSSWRWGASPHRHEPLLEFENGEYCQHLRTEGSIYYYGAAALGSLVFVLAAANGFARCVCVHVSGPAHVNTRESLVKYRVRARRNGIEQLV